MTVFAFSHRPLASIGAEVEFDLTRQLGGAQQEALRALLYDQGLLLFRGQSLSDEDQTRILSIFGPVLVEEGGHREIAADGNLGCCRLLYHSDLAFTPEPFKLLSLYGLEVEPERNITFFANGTKAAETLHRLAAKKFGRQIRRSPEWYMKPQLKATIAAYLNDHVHRTPELAAIFLTGVRKGISGMWLARHENWCGIEKALKATSVVASMHGKAKR